MKFIVTLLFFFCIAPAWAQVKKLPAKKTSAASKQTAKTTAIKTSALKNKQVSLAKKPLQPAAAAPSKPAVNILNNVALTSREQEMVNEINILRADPPKYSAYVDDYLQKMKSGKQERAAARELVAVLQKMKPLITLTINMTMYIDAKKYGAEMAKEDMMEHSSLPYFENLSAGHKDIREAMIDMLIDDGVPDRGHRNNLLNEKIKQVAAVELPGTINGIPYCYIWEFK